MLKKSVLVIIGILGLLFSPITKNLAETTDGNKVDIEEVFTIPTVPGKVNTAKIVNDEAVITDSGNSQVGAIWNKPGYEIDFKKNFHMVAYVSQKSLDGTDKTAADGLIFVIQGVKDGEVPTKWYTYSGGSLGALRGIEVSGALTPNSKEPGIPNSVGIEFDNYFNLPGFSLEGRYNTKNYFDGSLYDTTNKTASHVATVYPNDGVESAWNSEAGKSYGYYATWTGLPVVGQWRMTVNHYNPILMEKNELSNGQYNRLEVNWDVATQKLTYRVNDSGVITMDSAKLKANVLHDGITKAYWGFTGSTGPSVDKLTSTQKIYFEQVPSLVTAKTEIKLLREDNTEIANQSVVKGLSKVKAELNGEWQSGTEEWKGIKVNATLPESLKIVPGTTKVGDRLLPDTVWSGQTLTIGENIIPNLGKLNPRASVTFETVVDNTKAYTGQVVSDTFSGSNAILKAKSPAFSTEVEPLNASFETPHNAETFFYEPQKEKETPIPVKVNWEDASKGALDQKLAIMKNDEEVAVLTQKHSDTTEGKGVLEADLKPFINNFDDRNKEIPFGEFKLVYTATNSAGKKISVSLNLFKKSRPFIFDAVSLDKKVVKKGEDVPIEGKVTDFDSDRVTYHLLADDKEVATFGPDTLSPGQNKAFKFNWSTSAMALGSYKMSLYAVDNDTPENKSEVIQLGNLTIDGELTLKVPESFEVSNLQIGNGPAKQTSLGEVTVEDTRLNKGNWVLSAKLETQNFSQFTEEGKIKASTPNDFFSYRSEKEVKNITSGEEIPLLFGTPTDTTTTLEQTTKNGFYFKPNTSLLVGNYEATMKWNLALVPGG